MAIDEKVKLQAPFSKTILLEADVSVRRLPTADPAVLVSGEGVDHIIEESLRRESIALEATIPPISSKVITLTVGMGELEVPIIDLSVESTQLSSFPAISQDDSVHRPFFFFIHWCPIGSNYFLNLF